jgi:uncharacterized membrane protein
MITDRALMADARSQLKGKWGTLILVSLVYILITIIPGSLKNIGCVISLIIGGPMAFGITYYFLAFIRGKNPALEDLFKGFSIFSKTLIAYLLMVVFIVLWTLLLIVPGIIAALSYSMTFYLLVDNSDMTAQEAITKSKELMEGNKYRYFCFLGRFTGWVLLCILTLGIGFLWLFPYFMTSNAKFYETLVHPEKNATVAPANA